MGAKRPTSSYSRGFSLTEVIVVLGIIALLLAILLPVLARARASAASAACLNNLHRIVEAAQAHASEHEGYVGLAGVIEITSPSGSDSVAVDIVDSAMRKYQYLKTTVAWGGGYTNEVLPLPFSLAKHLGMTQPFDSIASTLQAAQSADRNALRIFQCPVVDVGERRAALPTHLVRTRSGDFVKLYALPLDYAFNGGVLAFHSDAVTTRRLGRGSLPVKDASHIVFATDMVSTPQLGTGTIAVAAFTPTPFPNPGQVVSLADAVNRTMSMVPGSAVPETTRHRRGPNVAFTDGHAESVAPAALSSCVLTPK
jgi:prepilin-type N-terminal cleavage/methylation domain-containing protein/prepilin-type processing-associated H-X9-DG protein